jgi:hypothetical protein
MPVRQEIREAGIPGEVMGALKPVVCVKGKR